MLAFVSNRYLKNDGIIECMKRSRLGKVWAVIPAHNESKSIGTVIRKARKYVDRVIVVDDGSTDDTFDVAKKQRAIVLHHVINIGKGGALKTGCDYACENGATHLVVLDADAQHDPDEIPRFLNALKKCDIVFGFRKRTSSMPFVLRFGNWFISEVIGFLYKVRLYDTQSGYRAFSKETYQKIRWNATDYSMESEMIANAGFHKLAYTQIPIKTIYSDKYKGTTILDGVKIVFNMFWFRFFNNY